MSTEEAASQRRANQQHDDHDNENAAVPEQINLRQSDQSLSALRRTPRLPEPTFDVAVPLGRYLAWPAPVKKDRTLRPTLAPRTHRVHQRGYRRRLPGTITATPCAAAICALLSSRPSCFVTSSSQADVPYGLGWAEGRETRRGEQHARGLRPDNVLIDCCEAKNEAARQPPGVPPSPMIRGPQAHCSTFSSACLLALTDWHAGNRRIHASPFSGGRPFIQRSPHHTTVNHVARQVGNGRPYCLEVGRQLPRHISVRHAGVVLNGTYGAFAHPLVVWRRQPAHEPPLPRSGQEVETNKANEEKQTLGHLLSVKMESRQTRNP
ncbi:uncharacterized protein J3D65DRAFT_602585 [Phyllosticta citribraziliensis]|uniref:Uncharacterized protein n=1 Tax=Phyllosticta citribraziliensis TaxID=989973 RepID=A0ABR1LTU9_9PEZI